MEPEGSARNSCNSWRTHAELTTVTSGMLWLAVTAVACTPAVCAN